MDDNWDGPRCPLCGARGARLMGHIYRGVYDGVLVWSCLDCGHAFPRFTDGKGRLTAVATKAADAINARRASEASGH